MDLDLFSFSSATIELSEIPQLQLSTNVVRIIPVILRSTAQSILVSNMLNHYFASTDDA